MPAITVMMLSLERFGAMHHFFGHVPHAGSQQIIRSDLQMVHSLSEFVSVFRPIFAMMFVTIVVMFMVSVFFVVFVFVISMVMIAVICVLVVSSLTTFTLFPFTMLTFVAFTMLCAPGSRLLLDIFSDAVSEFDQFFFADACLLHFRKSILERFHPFAMLSIPAIMFAVSLNDLSTLVLDGTMLLITFVRNQRNGDQHNDGQGKQETSRHR